ncbi:PIN domain nuclease, a component of toxin-antitoxin system (PIN domain) [Microbacterium testaceum StLB037]|uniref:PIN domain nuclease, a component of toxin-antitoxin system (PIN domain) n=1 Tax=Microbacterium testaceum (strain StLB037) TaxID=979556 RepID=A0A1H0L574_MICTS|nr:MULTISPECIES: type II toxin-antitoxin system VapC family toxin [Microbacterium]SDO63225.1 PIN domain nuclease, a component of toxin-antitoxin system (PIN domain) [Microbacterium testaceum StLB037]
MRYLLDTHTLLWALTAPDRLGPASSTILADPSSTIVVSAASAWEISTKQRIGKLPHADALVGGYARHLDRLGAERLPIDETHALLAGALQWDHRDPFNRMLAAQAMVESLTLLSSDDAFSRLAGLAVQW